MTLTLLEIINQVQRELGYPVSSTIVGNTDPTTVQMLALANRTLDTIRRMHRWTVCQFEYNLIVNTPVITTGDLTANSAVITNIPDTSGVAAETWTVSSLGVPQASRVLSVDSSTQVTMTMEATGASTDATVTFAQDTYPMPSGFDFYTNQSWWDRTNRWQLIGPDSPQQDQFQRSGIVAVGPRRHFRQLGPSNNRYRIWPPPVEISAPLQLVFEYVSLNTVAVNGYSATNPVVVSGGAGYALNDTIVPAGGTATTDATILVTGVTSGVITSAQIQTPGIYTIKPTNPVSQASTSGSGTGATFSIIWDNAYSQFFIADDDMPILDAQAIILGIKAYFWEIKGFNYMSMRNDFIDYVERQIARDGAAPNLTLARSPVSLLVSSWSVPDGSWPGTADGTGSP